MVWKLLSDSQWKRIEQMVPGKPGDVGRTGADNRLFVEAVLWIARTGSPWRDLPDEFGNWNSAYVRFVRWARAGVWQTVFAALAKDADFREAMIDSTLARAPPHAAGPKKAGAQAPGRSRGGLTRLSVSPAYRLVRKMSIVTASVAARGEVLRGALEAACLGECQAMLERRERRDDAQRSGRPLNAAQRPLIQGRPVICGPVGGGGNRSGSTAAPRWPAVTLS